MHVTVILSDSVVLSSSGYSPRIYLHTQPNPTCSLWYDHEWLKADYKPDSPTHPAVIHSCLDISVTGWGYALRAPTPHVFRISRIHESKYDWIYTNCVLVFVIYAFKLLFFEGCVDA